MASKKKKYIITNAGEDIFEMEYELSETQFNFLNKLFAEMNRKSHGFYTSYLCVRETKGD